jgi:hypothetical protein
MNGVRMKRINGIHMAIGYLVMVVGGGLMLAGFVYQRSLVFLFFLGIPVLIAGIVIRVRAGQCPYCKSYLTVSMTNMNVDVFHCPKCGGKIEIK